MQIVQQDDVQAKIVDVRNQKILIDTDVAELYGIETKQVNQEEFNKIHLDYWFQNRLELDKNILLISTGGIGLLITILSIVKPSTILELIFLGLSILVFLSVTLLILFIFKINADFLSKKMRNKKTAQIEVKLKRLDYYAQTGLLVGIIFAIIFGVLSITHSLSDLKRDSMSSNKIIGIANDSLSGLTIIENSLLQKNGGQSSETQQSNQSNSSVSQPQSNAGKE